MKTKKLTLTGKLVIFVIILALVLGGTFLLGGFNFLKSHNSASKTIQSAISKVIPSSNKATQTNTINLALDEKIDWKPILDANGGLTTKPGSIYDKLGLKVNIKIDNNNNMGVNDINSGKVDAFGNSINGYAAMYKKFKNSSVDTIMPVVIDSSQGADGIIANNSINNVNDIVGKRIAVPNMSSDQTTLLWLLAKSDITKDQFNQIKSNMKVYDSVGTTAQAFFSGQADIAGVRQPYLTKAKNTQGDKVLFSTKDATNIVSNGIIFRKDFIDQNGDTVTKFIDGALQAESQTTNFDNLRIEPSFKNNTDAEIQQMMSEVHFNDYTDNVNLLKGTAQSLFQDMSNVWNSVDVEADPSVSQQVFTDTYINKLSGKYTLRSTTTAKVDNATKQAAASQSDDSALLKKSVTINFQPNSANFLDANAAKQGLDQFVSIAKVLNGAIIQIEGNVADVGTSDPEASKQLSLQRAKTVADYLQQQGIDPSRFVVIGNGTSKQIADNKTQDGQIKNRRTDIMFKVIE